MLASNSCTIIVHIISERKKKEIMKIKDKIKFVDSKVIEITRRATSKILRRMEWGIAAWGAWLILGYTLLIYILRSSFGICGIIIFICSFSCSFPFSFIFCRFFFNDSHCIFLLLLPLLANCVCVLCLGVSCCYCCNSLHCRQAGRLLGKE